MFKIIQLHLTRLKTVYAYRSRDWKNIPIKENGEKLVVVPKEISFPYYHKIMHLSEENNIYLRESVLDNIYKARSLLLKHNFDLKVYDGWRSLNLQENLFWFYMKEFTVKRFQLHENFSQTKTIDDIKDLFNSLSPDMKIALKEANRTYVSWPSKDVLSPSPHTTGGAVDVWIFQKNEAVNLGVPFDWMEENAGAFYHLKLFRRRFSGNDKKICDNRNSLLFAMINNDFTCYCPEIWHYNLGNQMDSLVKGGHAKFSYIEP